MNIEGVEYKYLNFLGRNLLVSKCGIIRRKSNLYIYKSSPSNLGYIKAALMLPCGRRTAISVHRAVALTYLENPLNHPDVNHKDGIKSNNHVDNLEWMSRKENIQHSLKLGLRENGLKKQRKLARHRLVKELLASGGSIDFLALAFGVSRQIILKIKNNQDHFSERYEDLEKGISA